MKSTLLTHFRVTFSTLFRNADEILRVLPDLSIREEHLSLNRSAEAIWFDILNELSKREQIDNLFICNSVTDYLQHSELIFCQILWWSTQRDWDLEMLRNFYLYCVRYYKLQGMPEPEVPEVDLYLTNLWQLTKKAPFIEFVIHLAKHDKGRIGDLLRGLIDRLRKNFQYSLDQTHLDVVWELPVGKLTHNNVSYISVVLDRKVSGDYSIEIFFWKNGQGNDDILKREPHRNLSLIDVPHKLIETIRNNHHLLVENGRSLFIDFFLPTDLLLATDEQWQMPDQWKIPGARDSSVTFGERYVVAVRSLERLQDADFRLSWRKYEFDEQSLDDDGGLHPNIFWVDNQTEYGSSYLRRNLQSAQYCQCICAGLATILTENRFFELLEAGIPVAVWHRRQINTLTVKDMQLKIEASMVQKLPHKFKEWRTHTDIQIQEFANQLTLMWDFPKRIPPQYRLVSQSVKGE